MTACSCPADKVAYLSEYVATNAATLHGFMHPACHDVEPYRCTWCSEPGAEVWHIGHAHRDQGQRCKSEQIIRPPNTFSSKPSTPAKRTRRRNKPPSKRKPRGAA